MVSLLVSYYTEHINFFKMFSKNSFPTESTMGILFQIMKTKSIMLNCSFWSMEKSDKDKNYHII